MPHDQLRPTRRPRLLLALTLLVALQATPPAWAWRRLDHRVIAKLAERHLTDRARVDIKALLEPGKSLADCSTWADGHRRQKPRSAPWHYVDVSLDAERYDDLFTRDDPKKGVIVPKLRQFLNVPGNHDAAIAERRTALRLVVHLVGDLHQPLHVGDIPDTMKLRHH